jgi:WD40 repeat protein
MHSDLGGEDPLAKQLRQARAELVRRLRAGQDCRAEDFLQEYPALSESPGHAVDLILTEYDAREELGQSPSRELLYQRFPLFRDALERLFESDEEDVKDKLGLEEYEPLEEIGRGPMGEVWRARHIPSGREVALKMFAGGGYQDLERFRRGAEDQARLKHDNIVPVYEVSESGAYFVMELAEGGSLDRKIDGQPQPAAEAARCVELLARAMHFAHRAGIVHRDLKPANVVLTADGKPKITDLGLAKRMDASTALTQSGAMLGTLPYMAPEQVSGKPDAVDWRTDVYALGAILYEMLTGRPPFQAKGWPQLIQQVQTRLPERPRKVEAGVDLGLESVCLKCLEKKPYRRYGSAEQLADDLRRWLQDKRPRAHGLLARTGRKLRRHTAASMAAAILLALSAASAGWAVRERAIADRLESALRLAEVRLAENSLDRGLKLCERGDVGHGLLWLARALEKAPPDAIDLQVAIRAQIAGWQTRVNPLRACFDNPVPVTAAALSPDGRFVWVAGKDNRVRRWDAEIGEATILPVTLDSHCEAILWSPEGNSVLTVSRAGTAQRWAAATGHPIGKPLPHKVRVAAWGGASGEALVTAGKNDQTVRVWDATKDSLRETVLCSNCAVEVVAVSPDGSRILTGTVSQEQGTNSPRYFSTLQFWDTATVRTMGSPLILPARLRGAAFSHNEETRLLAFSDRHAQVWEVAGRKPLGKAVQLKGDIATAAFSPDGSTYLTGGFDRTARLWNAATGESAGSPFAHQATVYAVAYSRDGRTILTADSDKSLRLWRIAAGLSRGLALRHNSHVKTVAFDRDGRFVFTGSWDRTARIWDAATGTPHGAALTHPSHVLAVVPSPDGKTLLTVAWDKRVRLWKTDTGEPLAGPLFHPVRVSKAVFSPDGQTVLTCCYDGSVRFWGTKKGNLLGLVARAHVGDAVAAAFNFDGSVACTGGVDGTARLWTVATCQPRGPIFPHGATVWDVAISKHGRLLTGGGDQRALLWDLDSGRQLGRELWHGNTVKVVVFSPDGKLALTGSEDGTAMLWDTETGKPLCRPLAHDDYVTAVAFRPDGRMILTASRDGSARLWDVATGKSLGPPLAHAGPVWAVAFSPDGLLAITGSDDKTARLWTLPVPTQGTAELITVRTEMMTGLYLDDNDVLRQFDAATWQQRRDRTAE